MITIISLICGKIKEQSDIIRCTTDISLNCSMQPLWLLLLRNFLLARAAIFTCDA